MGKGKLLKDIYYKETLKLILKSNDEKQILILLNELLRKNSLKKSLFNYNSNLKVLLRWIVRFFYDIRFKSIIFCVLEEIINYQKYNLDNFPKLCYEWIIIVKKIKEEFEYLKKLMKLQGVLRLISE